ncbi:MAG: urea ABC transporter permease subunit UrtB [Gammaproteobacteria bacterium]|nr:urea ABC transporter permease subunit UrtB [Gammaproteobacteria bacterium]
MKSANKIHKWLLAVLWTLLANGAMAVPASPASALEENVQALNADSFAGREKAIMKLSAQKHEGVTRLLRSLLEGDLYYRKADGRVVLARREGRGYAISDAVSGKELGEVGRRDVKRIAINNRLRSLLRDEIARLSLGSPDPRIRLNSVQQMYGELEPAGIALLEKLKRTERDDGVLAAIEAALALAELKSDDLDRQLDAVERLSGSLEPAVRNELQALVARNSDGDYVVTDRQLREAADRALQSIETMRHMSRLVETTFFGLSLGSVLLLSAIGLAITFGVMGVINMAHGELMMLGAYTTYLVQAAMPNHIDQSLFVAIPAAFLVAGAFGVAIERGIIRFLYGRPLETLLATFGVSLILQQLVRTTISAQNVTVSNPSWMSGSLDLNPALSLTFNRLYILAFAILVFIGLMLILKQTALGLQVRAVAQNRAMARAMGIRSDWVDAMTFGLGSGIAGIAGVALSQLTNVGPNMGQGYIIDSFMVVVFGGVGNLWGTLVGAFSLGVANKFLEPWAGAVLAKILVLVLIILFIQKRPRGLFPHKGRTAEG